MDEGNIYPLKAYNVGNFNSNNEFMILIGKKKSGKTTLLFNIVKHHADTIRIIIVFSGSEGGNHQYERQCIPHKFIQIKNVHGMLACAWKILKTYGRGALLVFDDLPLDQLNYQAAFKELAIMNRHHNAGVIVLSHYINQLMPLFKSNATTVAVMADNNTTNHQKYYETFFGTFHSVSDFRANFKKYTTNHSALVAFQETQSYDVEKVVSFYKTEKITTPFFIHHMMPLYDEYQLGDFALRINIEKDCPKKIPPKVLKEMKEKMIAAEHTIQSKYNPNNTNVDIIKPIIFIRMRPVINKDNDTYEWYESMTKVPEYVKSKTKYHNVQLECKRLFKECL